MLVILTVMALVERTSPRCAHLNSLNLTLRGQIFDYMNVQSIHNATFANALPDNYLAIARDLANWHEYNVFSDDSFDGIGNSTL